MKNKFSHERFYNSLNEFYSQIKNYVSPKNRAYNNLDHDSRSFLGLEPEKIEASKYGYSEGIKDLELIQDLTDIQGGNCFAYKWDETDGDSMNMDRYYDSMPCLQKRYRKQGSKNGKFIDIYVNLSESFKVTAKQMKIKMLTAVNIADNFEAQNIRCRILSCSILLLNLKNDGREKDKITILLKDYNDTINLSLLLNALSPWFFRKHILKDITGKFLVNSGIGFPRNINKENTKDSIYIDKGQCLTVETAKQFIKSIENID